MNSIIYPNIELRDAYNRMGAITYLRKQGKDGKWYKIQFARWLTRDIKDNTKDLEARLTRLLESDVYYFIICGIVDTEGKLKLEDDSDWCVLDSLQISEEVRIYAILNSIPYDLAEKWLTKKEDYQ